MWFHPWPRHRCEELGEAWSQPENLVGNSPFVLGEYDDRYGLLVASDRWFGSRSNVRDVRVAFERIWIGERAAVLPLQYTRSAALLRPWIDGFWVTPLAPSRFEQVTVRR